MIRIDVFKIDEYKYTLDKDLQSYTAWVQKALERGYKPGYIFGTDKVRFSYTGDDKAHNPYDFLVTMV